MKGMESKIRRNPKYYSDLNERREKLKLISVPDLIGEEWVDIIGYEGFYKISNLARIKSVCRTVIQKRGTSVIKPEQLLKLGKNSDGYFLVRLTKDRIARTYSFHILVAKTFVPNPNNLTEVNHIDGNKLNCLPNNLEWVTHKENMGHAVKTGLRKYKKGTNDYFKFKLSESQILEIYKSEERTGVLASKFNITKSSIQRIKSGKTYSGVTKDGKSLSMAYHKISQTVADEIRSSKLNQRQICEKYKISKGLIYNIKNNKSYNGFDK